MGRMVDSDPRGAPEARVGFVVRPSVAITLPYAAATALLLLFALLTARWPPEGEPLRVIGGLSLAVVSVVDVLLVAWLAADLRGLWRRSGPARRGPLAGVILALVNVALLQAGAILAYQPLLMR